MAGKHVKRLHEHDSGADVPSGPFRLMNVFDGNTTVQVGYRVWDQRVSRGTPQDSEAFFHKRSDAIKYIEGRLQRVVFR